MSKENIVIRTTKPEDALRVLQIQKEILAEGIFLTTSSEEFDKTVEQQKVWLEKILYNDKETMLVAETSRGIVGWVVFLSTNFVNK